MKALKAFTINHAGLREGKHSFDYTIDKKFLELFETTLVENADIQVDLLLEKQSGFLSLHFEWEGTVAACCDICNEDFDLPVSGIENIIIKFVQELPEDNAEPEIIYVLQGESQINIALPLYEAIMLNIPIRKVHPEDENGVPNCDPKILAILKGEEETEKIEESDEETGGSSVWDELKKLKDSDQ